MSSHRIFAVLAVGAAAAAYAPAAHAQALPAPLPLVRNLDLECYQTPGPALNANVMLTHLNPVLLGLNLPPHVVAVHELQQTCVPVRKNNAAIPAGVLPFVSQIDFACYRVDANPFANPVPLNLTHLNPVLANQPAHNVALIKPAQLCLPIAKNGVLPPDQVLQLARFVDLECYDVNPAAVPPFVVGLSQLNPQLAVIPPHPMNLVSSPRQLCVPVRKNAQVIPPAVLADVRWIDLEKFAASPAVPIAPVNVVLSHLNPLFVNVQPIQVVLAQAVALMVPVAKNNMFPPAN